MALAWVRFKGRLYRILLRFGRDFSASTCGSVGQMRLRSPCCLGSDGRAFSMLAASFDEDNASQMLRNCRCRMQR
jgi:hypothetical protein